MNRRGFLGGLLAAPAVIVTPGLLMPVRVWTEPNPDFSRFGSGSADELSARFKAFKDALIYGHGMVMVSDSGVTHVPLEDAMVATRWRASDTMRLQQRKIVA